MTETCLPLAQLLLFVILTTNMIFHRSMKYAREKGGKPREVTRMPRYHFGNDYKNHCKHKTVEGMVQSIKNMCDFTLTMHTTR